MIFQKKQGAFYFLPDKKSPHLTICSDSFLITVYIYTNKI